MSTCGEVGSDVHALMKKLAIRWVEARSATHSNESQHRAEGTEVARLRWRFSLVLQQALSFRTRRHLCRQGVALADTRQLRLQGLVFVNARCAVGVTVSEGREGANGVGGGIGVGGANRDGNGVGGGNGDVNGDEHRDGAGTGTTVTGVEGNEMNIRWKRGREREREQGWRPVDEHNMGSGTGAGTEMRAGVEIGTGTETGTGLRTRSGRIGKRGRSTRNRTIVADAMWEGVRLGRKKKKT